MMSRLESGSPSARSIPLVSVVVPAYQASGTIGRVLEALEASDLPRRDWELIVVDDASSDDTALLAAQHADAVIRLPDAPRGPAYARNRGSELARAPFVAFIDADVMVAPETLRLLVEPIERDPSIGTLSAMLDDGQSTPGITTRYRNLRRHVHQRLHADEPEALWSGCCIVRRSLFQTAGHFDEWHFAGPQDEVREFGRRIVQAGYRVAAVPEVRATHLKRFGLRTLVGDIWRRRITHVRLAPQTARIHPRELLAILGIGLASAYLVIGRGSWAIAAAGAIALALLLDAPLFVFLLRRAGLAFALAAVPLHAAALVIHGLAHGAGVLLRHAIGAPRPDPTHEAYSEIGLKGWPPPPYRPKPADPRPAAAAGEPR